jgi:predicted DNA-binding transcriptional regulator AlpA
MKQDLFRGLNMSAKTQERGIPMIEEVPPLPRPELLRAVETAPGIAAEQVSAAGAAVIAGVGESTWWRLHAGGKVPRPNKLGGKTLWRVEELKRWIAAGCPDRASWQAMEAARNGKR